MRYVICEKKKGTTGASYCSYCDMQESFKPTPKYKSEPEERLMESLTSVNHHSHMLRTASSIRSCCLMPAVTHWSSSVSNRELLLKLMVHISAATHFLTRDSRTCALSLRTWLIMLKVALCLSVRWERTATQGRGLESCSVNVLLKLLLPC